MDRAALEDLFDPVVKVSVRRMFGGHGIYADGMMFALEAGGAVYLRVDGETEPAFREAGARPFSHAGAARTVVLPYWLLPEDAYEDPDELRRWVVLGKAAAQRHARAKADSAARKQRSPRPKTQKAGESRPRRGRGSRGQATSE